MRTLRTLTTICARLSTASLSLLVWLYLFGFDKIKDNIMWLLEIRKNRAVQAAGFRSLIIDIISQQPEPQAFNFALIL